MFGSVNWADGYVHQGFREYLSLEDGAVSHDLLHCQVRQFQSNPLSESVRFTQFLLPMARRKPGCFKPSHSGALAELPPSYPRE